MKKALKRSLSLSLALIMILCMVPNVFALDNSSTIVVGRNRAPLRTISYEEGEVIERYAEGTSLTYNRLFINSKKNLWYVVPLGDNKQGYIYSGNIKEVYTGKDAVIEAQVVINRDLLDKDKCREYADKLLATGYTQTQIAKELYAHAIGYYGSNSVLESKAKAYLTDAVICALFPDKCVSQVMLTQAIIAFSDYVNEKAGCVEIGENGGFKGITRKVIYDILWNITA